MRPTFVYFLRPLRRAGPVKIGCSEYPTDRLAFFMTWSPLVLEIAATLPGDQKLERRIHSRFADTHSHREWFHASAELTEFIAAVAAGQPIAALIDMEAPLRSLKKVIRAKRVFTPERRQYLSYAARLRIAYQRLPGIREPRDIDSIMTHWSIATSGHKPRWTNATGALPTPQDMERIGAVLRDPVMHGLTLAEKYKKVA